MREMMENNPELPKLLRRNSNHLPVGEALTSPMKAVIKEIFPSLPSKEVNFEEFSAAPESDSDQASWAKK